MIKLSKPYITEEAIDNVTEVLRSGNLVQGEYVERLENALKEYLEVKHAILVSSGTAALHLSVIALGIKDGDEVIVPAFTFPATANIVEQVGAKPILVDIALDDFCIDTSQIEPLITDNTKAIIPVHEFGQSADLEPIMLLARKYGIEVIEDAACALGTENNGQKIGTLGKLGCFSLHPRKAITTGEGGVVVTNDDELAGKIKSLRNHGIKVHNGKYDFVYAGFNYRMTNFQAALGLPQLLEIEEIIEKRIRMAERYDKELHNIAEIKTPVRFKNRKAVYQTYHIIVDGEIDRDKLIRSLKDEGIETNLGAQALNCLSYYKSKYNYKEIDFPNSAKAFKQGLALPLGIHLNLNEILNICEKLRNALIVDN